MVMIIPTRVNLLTTPVTTGNVPTVKVEEVGDPGEATKGTTSIRTTQRRNKPLLNPLKVPPPRKDDDPLSSLAPNPFFIRFHFLN